jgi:histone-lysine N-methyltransferase SETMAR
MDGGNEQSFHKILFHNWSICDSNISIGAKAYVNEAVNRSNVFLWYSKFRDGRELIEDDERCGRPKSTRTEVNIAAVADVVKNDHRIASRTTEESLNIPKTVVLQIPKKDLVKKKLCARFVPHPLTTEEREDRVTSCQDISAMADADKLVFKKIITEGETWCSAYDPETKRQSSEWVGETCLRPKKLKFQRSRIKTMLIIFFDSKSVVHKEFVSEGKTVNVEFYIGVTVSLLKRIQRVRPAAFCCRDFFLLHDNAPAHKLQVFANF